MSDLEKVLSTPIARPVKEITADYCKEGIENIYVPGGWDNEIERYYCIPDEMNFVSIESNLTGGRRRRIHKRRKLRRCTSGACMR